MTHLEEFKVLLDKVGIDYKLSINHILSIKRETESIDGEPFIATMSFIFNDNLNFKSLEVDL